MMIVAIAASYLQLSWTLLGCHDFKVWIEFDNVVDGLADVVGTCSIESAVVILARIGYIPGTASSRFLAASNFGEEYCSST